MPVLLHCNEHKAAEQILKSSAANSSKNRAHKKPQQQCCWGFRFKNTRLLNERYLTAFGKRNGSHVDTIFQTLVRSKIDTYLFDNITANFLDGGNSLWADTNLERP